MKTECIEQNIEGKQRRRVDNIYKCGYVQMWRCAKSAKRRLPQVAKTYETIARRCSTIP